MATKSTIHPLNHTLLLTYSKNNVKLNLMEFFSLDRNTDELITTHVKNGDIFALNDLKNSLQYDHQAAVQRYKYCIETEDTIALMASDGTANKNELTEAKMRTSQALYDQRRLLDQYSMANYHLNGLIDDVDLSDDTIAASFD